MSSPAHTDSSFSFEEQDLANPLAVLLREDVHGNPYPWYDFMRAHAPVTQDPMGMWFITAHDLVNEVLTSPHTTTESQNVMRLLPMPDDLWTQYYPHELLFTDGERHAFLRKFANNAFKPRRVRQLRGRLEADVDRYLDRIADEGSMDLVSDLAHPFAILTVMRMIGLPDEDVESIERWSTAMAALLDISKLLDPTYREPAIAAFGECVQYVGGLLEERAQDPRDDVLSDFAASLGEPDGLSREDIMGIVIRGMINAGHATTTSQMGNNMLSMLAFPDQMQKLADNPALAVNAIEELFRYDPAIQTSPRCAARDMEVGGQLVEEGHLMWLFGGAANRDPAAFDNPNVVDIERTVTGSLASGNGEHYCLGATLARLETEIALTKTLDRFTNIELTMPAGDLPRDSNLTVRGCTSIPLTFDRR